MNKSLRVFFGCLFVFAVSSICADVVHLKSGGSVEGRVIERTASSVEIDIGAGSITLSMESVDRIEEGRSPLDDYDDRAARLDENDRDGWLELARWASSEGLGTQSRRAYEKVLSISPDHPEANAGLGRVEHDGRWMSEEEAYRARGYVKYGGVWMTPAEQEAILREQGEARAASDAARQARSADAKARDADARAREAEAEAEAQVAAQGIPLWWGTWGPGPTAWPTQPTQPTQPVTHPVRVVE